MSNKLKSEQTVSGLEETKKGGQVRMGRSALQPVGTRSRAIRRGASTEGLITNGRGVEKGFIHVDWCVFTVQVYWTLRRRIARERVPTSRNALRPFGRVPLSGFLD